MVTGRELKMHLLLTALTVVACVLALGAAEMAYRVWLRTHMSPPGLTYRVAPFMYVEYDPEHGERFKPDRELWVSYIRDGGLVWGTVVSRSNRDGLGGRTTLEDYDAAEVKILVFGDSFSHWNQRGASWPDLLQTELERRLGRRVAVLNYARGAYGVIQMLELAAERVAALKPDLVILAPIGDDFNRARWWCKEIEKDGATRWMLSASPDSFFDYRVSIDEVLVDPRATPQWCDSTWRQGGFDPVLSSLNRRYAALAREVTVVTRHVDLVTLRWSYLYGRIVRHDPFGNRRALPRVPYSDYRADPGVMRALERLRSFKVPIMLAYLPVIGEMNAGKTLMSRQDRRLRASLERELGRRFEEFQSDHLGAVPEQFDLRPFDTHPSRAALEFYAQNIAARCVRGYLPVLSAGTPR
jgi:hypothetical protein